ncbi:MAG: ROK family protein [Limnochordia bacterium]|jgi:glucokinase
MTEERVAIGVDVGGTTFSVALVDRQGKILFLDEAETLAEQGAEAVVERIIASIRRLLDKAEVGPEGLAGIGMGIPGLHDRERGVVITSPNLKWENVPIRDRVRSVIDTNFYMDGDVRVAAIGERYFGAAADCDNFIFVTLGTGIGSGIFIDGRLYRGPNGYAGEVGHQTIVEAGPRCGCGNYGCVEALAGNKGIIERARQALQDEDAPLLMQEIGGDLSRITPAALYRAAVAGCSLSRRVLADTGRYVGTAMANLVNVLNPQRIIIGGGVAQAGDMILGPLRDTIKERAMGPNAETVEVVPAGLGNKAGMLGAASMALFDLQ